MLAGKPTPSRQRCTSSRAVADIVPPDLGAGSDAAPRRVEPRLPAPPRAKRDPRRARVPQDNPKR
ncbi:hypothetical protein GCM10009660_22030 [Catellatospora bangladeshensis]